MHKKRKSCRWIGPRKCLPVSAALNEYEKVNAFAYLGSIIEADEGSSAEIQRQITLSKLAMTRLRNIKCSNEISRKTRKKLIQSLVFSVLLCGAETWALKAHDKRRIDAFEIWAWLAEDVENVMDSAMNQHFNRQRNTGASLVNYFMRESHSKVL